MALLQIKNKVFKEPKRKRHIAYSKVAIDKPLNSHQTQYKSENNGIVVLKYQERSFFGVGEETVKIEPRILHMPASFQNEATSVDPW